MDVREDLPKVSIETEQDWRRIQNNISTALLARLDHELDSCGQTGDKDALLPHVHQFLDDLFDISRPNLRINGRTTEEPCGDEEDVEPFDEALDRHIWSLSDQRLKWDKEVADRRRWKPQEIERSVKESLEEHRLCDSDGSEGFNDTFNVELKQVDRQPQQSLLNVASVGPDLLHTVKLQRRRANGVIHASAEVKVLMRP